MPNNNKVVNACDPQLLSGFFAALMTFAENTSGNLQTISMNNSNYYFHKDSDFYFILETDLVNPKIAYEDFMGLLKDITQYFIGYVNIKELDTDFMEIIEDENFSNSIQEKISRLYRRSLLKTV
jgi:hypothetical protein